MSLGIRVLQIMDMFGQLLLMIRHRCLSFQKRKEIENLRSLITWEIWLSMVSLLFVEDLQGQFFYSQITIGCRILGAAPVPIPDISPALPRVDLTQPPPDSWRKIYLESGPASLAKAIRQHQPALITDTTWRDAHQSHIGFVFVLVFSSFFVDSLFQFQQPE